MRSRLLQRIDDLAELIGELPRPMLHERLRERAIMRERIGPGALGRLREPELVETPPHRAEFWFALDGLCPLPASGARKAGPRSNLFRNAVRFTPSPRVRGEGQG